MAHACLEALERECPAKTDGEDYYRPATSVWAHAVEFFARNGETNGFRKLIERPRRDERRMLLDDASYPDVLVARANDTGGMLRAVLHPGRRRPAGYRLLGSAPRGRYACDGTEEAEVMADRAGAARSHVRFAGRREIRLRPVHRRRDHGLLRSDGECDRQRCLA